MLHSRGDRSSSYMALCLCCLFLHAPWRLRMLRMLLCVPHADIESSFKQTNYMCTCRSMQSTSTMQAPRWHHWVAPRTLCGTSQALTAQAAVCQWWRWDTPKTARARYIMGGAGLCSYANSSGGACILLVDCVHWACSSCSCKCMAHCCYAAQVLACCHAVCAAGMAAAAWL